MRLRHVRGAREFLESQKDVVITNIRDLDVSTIFKNKNEVHMEIGCGKGKFILEMAKTFPSVNFLAIEKYDSVLLRAVEKYLSLEERPENLKFILADFSDLAPKIKEGSIKTIYLNFSDPWPKNPQAKRRLTSLNFLTIYKNILTSDGLIIQKTDNVPLFNYSLQEYEKADFKVMEKTYDLHSTDIFNITTEFEDKWSLKGPICYVKVSK